MVRDHPIAVMLWSDRSRGAREMTLAPGAPASGRRTIRRDPRPRSRMGRRQLLLAAAFLGVVCAVAGPVGGATPATPAAVTLSSAEASSFERALGALAARGHMSIVAEAGPFRADVDDAMVPPALLEPEPPAEVLGLVASMYDYGVCRVGTVYSLSKRYSDPFDLPLLSTAECTRTVEEFCRLSGPFDPKLDFRGGRLAAARRGVVQQFAASLSPAQMGAMQGDGLPVRALSLTQQGLVRRITLQFYIGKDLNIARGVLGWLQEGERRGAIVRQPSGETPDLFGLTIASSLNGAPTFEPLSGEYALQTAAGLSYLPPKGTEGVEDPTIPAGALPERPSADETTIGQLLQGLSASPGQDLRIDVDPSLRDKRVIALGLEGAVSRDVVEGVAEIYGLATVSQSNGTHRIVHLSLPPPAAPPWSVDKLPPVLASAVPAPLLRALHTNDLFEALDMANRASLISYFTGDRAFAPDVPWNRSRRPPDEPETPAELKEAMKDRRAWVYGRKWTEQYMGAAGDILSRPGGLRIAAIRRLRSLTESRLDRARPAELPVRDLDQPSRDAFSTVLLSECFRSLAVILCQPVPGYVKDFATDVLKGGVTTGPDGKERFAVFVCTPKPANHGVQQQVGIAGVEYSR